MQVRQCRAQPRRATQGPLGRQDFSKGCVVRLKRAYNQNVEVGIADLNPRRFSLWNFAPPRRTVVCQCGTQPLCCRVVGLSLTRPQQHLAVRYR